jgi:penicillin G amidase
VRRPALAALLACALAAPVADADVRRAGSVLPPGQSGFVSASGLASGSGSPHLHDQTQPFLDFELKDARFGQPGLEETPRAGVTVRRDDYGVPAIVGATSDDVWFGVGYAVAQDRLFQLEIFRRATTGHLAEVLGRSYVPRDLATRRDFYTLAEVERQLAALPPQLAARFASYAEGINAWIARTRSDPSRTPGEFAALGIAPREFSAVDVASIGIYLARTVPDDGPGEYRNARALQALGERTFDRVLPLRSPSVPTSVPRSDGAFPRGPRRGARAERAALRRSARYVRRLPLPPEEPPYPTGESRVPPPVDPPREEAARRAAATAAAIGPGSLGRGGSNMWAIRSRDGGATLFNGPQLGYDIPSLFVEIEVHGPGVDVRGMTAPGAPVIAVGHNGRVAWGVTTGASDQDDVYAEQLVGDEGYRFRGRTEAMECRTERIEWNPPPTELIPGGAPPDLSRGSEDVRLCRTVHGPVEVVREGVAYARRYATWMRELETLNGLAAVNAAQSVEDVDAAMDLVTWNENLMAADDSGSIGYWHPGLLPARPRGFDERLPYPGTGEAEWRGFLPPSRRPQSIDPRQGYLYNWNNPPSAAWTQADAGTRTILNGGFNRAALLGRLVRSAARAGGGWERTLAVDRAAGTTSQGRPPAATRLRRASRGARGAARVVLRTIRAWDGNYSRTDEQGRVEPGLAAWDAFKREAVELATGRFGEAIRALEGGRGAEHAFDTTNLEAYALRTLSARGYRLAAARAHARLARRFGSEDPAAWRETRQTYEPGATGAASWDPIPFYDRGSIQFAAELGP